jgi:nucleoside-diphosphate-sugar epimerase
MRCLVTGASGFLGSHLVRELLARQHSVVVLLRPGSHTERLQDCLSRVSIVHGSLEDTSELLRTLQHEPVDATFHLAWSGVTAEHRNGIEQVTKNVIHSLELWEVLHNIGCKVFIGVGSQAEYGPHPGVLREDMPMAPVTAYGSAKLALGILLKQLCAVAEMRFVWLRLFSAYGPGDDERHMVPSLIRALMRREKPALTAGDQVWDYLYVTDVANALCASLESNAAGVFNLGSGISCILREFISQVRDNIDPALPLGFGEVPYRCDQVMNLSADVSRLKAATGWMPAISLPKGTRKTVEWYRNNIQGSADHSTSSCLILP